MESESSQLAEIKRNSLQSEVALNRELRPFVTISKIDLLGELSDGKSIQGRAEMLNSGRTPALNLQRYADKYVCFPDDNKGEFAVMSTAEDAVDAMTHNGDKAHAKILVKAGDGLFVQTYYKGVVNGDAILYDKVDGNYRLDFDKPIHHGRIIYLINWKTGRYRMQVYALDYNKNLPAEEKSGKCELIHPGDSTSVAGSK